MKTWGTSTRLEATSTARPMATPRETGRPKIWMLILQS